MRTKTDFAAFGDAVRALRGDGPIGDLLTYLRRVKCDDAILPLLTDAIDPQGSSPAKFELSNRGRGRPRRRNVDVVAYRTAAARAKRRIDDGGSYEAELTQACSETGLSRSEMAAWLSSNTNGPLRSQALMDRLKRDRQMRGLFEAGETEAMAIHKIAAKAVRRINNGADLEAELQTAALEADRSNEEMHSWIAGVAESERWQRFNSLI